MTPVLSARTPVARADLIRRFDQSSPATARPVEQLRSIHLEMVDAVVSADGLARVATIAARVTACTVAIVVPRLGSPIVSPPALEEEALGALARYVNERLRDQPARVPESVVGEVPINAADEMIGLVVLLSPPARTTLADATEVLRLAAAATLARVAIEEARHEVEEGLRDTFLEELRSQAPPSAADIVRRALRLGCDVSRGAIVLCALGDPQRPRRLMATIAADVPDALMQSLDGRVYAVLPAVECDDPADRTVELADAVAARLGRHGPVGISSFYADPGELRKALDEAELMADVLRGSGAPTAQVAGTGTYRLLLRLFVTHPDDLWTFYERTVGPVVRYDGHYGTDLLSTLDSYLANNCNMNATAAAVFAHRHTIAYRLDRVRELTGLDPAQCEDRERIGLGLKAYRILAPRVHL
jgi:sugar diacid utilization regulator